jgi:hypothetical protein
MFSFRDLSGNFDEKRISAFFIFIYLMGASTMDLFTDFKPSEFVFLGLLGTFAALLGLTIPENLASLKSQSKKDNNSKNADNPAEGAPFEDESA